MAGVHQYQLERGAGLAVPGQHTGGIRHPVASAGEGDERTGEDRAGP